MFYANFLINLLVSTSIAASGASFSAPISVSETQIRVPDVPFYSQFVDIKDSEWKKIGCGIASLAMLIEFYKPEMVEINTLLKEGIAAGAYLDGAGWTHKGLSLLAIKYGLKSTTHDLSGLNSDAAFAQFEEYLKNGPVIASVHYKFDINSSIPHLAVINGIEGDNIYYNDPAEKSAGNKISIEDFIKVWKKRFIVVRS